MHQFASWSFFLACKSPTPTFAWALLNVCWSPWGTRMPLLSAMFGDLCVISIVLCCSKLLFAISLLWFHPGLSESHPALHAVQWGAGKKPKGVENLKQLGDEVRKRPKPQDERWVCWLFKNSWAQRQIQTGKQRQSLPCSGLVAWRLPQTQNLKSSALALSTDPASACGRLPGSNSSETALNSLKRSGQNVGKAMKRSLSNRTQTLS